MRLVVDASTLVAEALRVRGRALLAHPDLDLVTPAEAWDEARHELRKRVGLMVHYGHVAAAGAGELLGDALATIEARVTLSPTEVYARRMDEARLRTPRDAGDAPLVALALVLDCGIWTSDRDFFGCGVPVWTSETLQPHLERVEER